MATAAQRALYGDDRTNPVQAALNPYQQPLTTPSYMPKTSIMKPQVGATTPLAAPAQSAGMMPGAPPPASTDPNAELAKWGYQGPLGLNDYEQEGLNYIADIFANKSAMGELDPASEFYKSLVGGDYGAESESYLQGVLDPMRASAMQTYDEMSKALAGRFSNVGAYYGGKSGVAQGRLASDTQRNMSEQEGRLRYQRYTDDLNSRLSGASGLQGISGQRAGLENNYLSQLLGGGNLITGREQYNTQEYQGAIEKAYQDWVRARQEQLMPFQIGQNLLGTSGVENIVTQDPGILATILGAAGNVGASYAYGKAIK
jgi:hypothetical protein